MENISLFFVHTNFSLIPEEQRSTLQKQLIKTWLDGCIVCYNITSLFSFSLESLASVTLLILVDVLLYVSDLKWGHNITASEVTIMEVYFYHKAFKRYMLDVIWKPGNQKAEMTWDEPKTMSWLNLQTKRFGFFKKSLGVMCWQGISSIWLCQLIK